MYSYVAIGYLNYIVFVSSDFIHENNIDQLIIVFEKNKTEHLPTPVFGILLLNLSCFT